MSFSNSSKGHSQESASNPSTKRNRLDRIDRQYMQATVQAVEAAGPWVLFAMSS